MRIIEDDILKVVERMRLLKVTADSTLITADSTKDNSFINYMYDHPVELNNRLLLMDGSPALSQKKYPLVALRLDNPAPTSGDMIYYNLSIVIMVYTNASYNKEQRQQLVFKPKLYPLYELFFKALKETRLFTWPTPIGGKATLQMPEHTRIDRYFWGTSTKNGNVSNIISDPIDAIEIVDLKINSRDKKC